MKVPHVRFRELATACALFLGLAWSAPATAQVTWGSTSAGTYTWSDTANWLGGVAPGTSGTALFGTTITGPLTVSTGVWTGTQAIGALTFDSTNAVTISSGTDRVLRISNGITVTAGTHTLAGNYAGVSTTRDYLLGSGTFSIASGSQLTISGRVNQVTSNPTYTKSGAGTLFLSGTNGGSGSWTFGTGSFSVNEGVLAFGSPANVTGNSGNRYSVSSGAAMELRNATYVSGTLTLNGDGIGGTGALRSTTGASSVNSSVHPIVLGSHASIGVDGGAALQILRSITGEFSLAKVGSGTLTLSASNTHSGGTQIAAGTLQLGSSTALPTSSAVTLGTGSTSGVLAFNGNTATLGAITFNGSGSQLSGTASGGGLNLLASGTNNATITVASGSHALHPDTTLQSNTVINVAAGSLFSLHGVIDGSKSLTQIGSGTVAIYGANSYSGGTYLNSGYLSVQNTGLVGPVAVAAGAVVGGSGMIGGALSGAGLVSPGNSPGILTAGQFDPTSGLDAAFEFTAFSPVYNASSASENDVLQLTSGSPFIGSLGSGNVIDVYFNVDSIASGDSFEGGFFTGLSAGDLFSAVENAGFQYWIKDNTGTTVFNGINYSTLTSVAGITGVTLKTADVTRTFSSGSVSGSVTQFVIVPEPALLAYAGIGIAVAAQALRRRRLMMARARSTGRALLSSNRTRFPTAAPRSSR